VRIERDRKKKLVVAFHFLRSEAVGPNKTGWKCDQCRRQGLEVRRRCGFLGEEQRGAPRVVWVRGAAASEECPRSLVTPASIEFVEKFFASKVSSTGELTAREVEAFLLLEKEWRAEQANGQ
jgi:hypothetical protein